MRCSLAIAFLSLTVAGVAGAQTTRPAVTLTVGDPAPPLRLGAMIQGEAVERFVAGTVYVLEFWSTTCGPCRTVIPALSDIQKQYPAVVVIGVDVLDVDANVAPFVKRLGDRMSYRVALDDKRDSTDGAMNVMWRHAAGERSVPSTFVVDRAGRIAWIGHPDNLAPVLAKVVADTYDIAASEAKRAKARTLFERADACKKRGDVAGIGETLTEVEAVDPDRRRDADFARFTLWVDTELQREAIAAGDRCIESAEGESASQGLQWMAIQVLWLDRPSAATIAVGHRAIRRALALREYGTAQLWDSEARLFAIEGRWSDAIGSERKAIDAMTADDADAGYLDTLTLLQQNRLPPPYPR